MAMTTINIDTETKEKAQKLFKELGLNLSTAINIFLKQSIKENGIPFYIKNTNNNFLNAMKEVEEIEKGIIKPKMYNNAIEMVEDILKNE